MKRLNRWARRSALVVSVLGVGALAAGNVAAGGGGAVAAAAGKRAAPAAGKKSPITVAWLATLTGADAADGMAQVKGFKLGLGVFGDTVDGHKIEASYLNSESTPTIALSAAKRAVETYHASVILGPLLGNLLAAVAPYVLSRDVPQLTYATSGYTQIKADVQFKAGFVTGYTPTQVATEGAKWAYDTMHWHHITTLADDYNYGWESVGGFDKEFTKLGGRITKTIWVPVTRADVSTYVSEIPSTTQAVFTELLGPQGTNFYSQMKAYGLTTKVGVLGMASTIDQSVLSTVTVAAATAPKSYGVSQYCTEISGKVNKAFTTAYHKAYGVWPTGLSESAYTDAEILVSALKKMDGVIKSEKELANVLASVKVVAPVGPFSITRATYAPLENVYLCKIEDKTGSARDVPIRIYKDVHPWGLLSISTWKKTFTSDTTSRPSA